MHLVAANLGYVKAPMEAYAGKEEWADHHPDDSGCQVDGFTLSTSCLTCPLSLCKHDSWGPGSPVDEWRKALRERLRAEREAGKPILSDVQKEAQKVMAEAESRLAVWTATAGPPSDPVQVRRFERLRAFLSQNPGPFSVTQLRQASNFSHVEAIRAAITLGCLVTVTLSTHGKPMYQISKPASPVQLELRLAS
jgi:hypothetical protein